MKWTFFSRERSVEEARRRYVNPVDESLMRRIEEQRERLRAAGVRATPLLRSYCDASAPRDGSSEPGAGQQHS